MLIFSIFPVSDRLLKHYNNFSHYLGIWAVTLIDESQILPPSTGVNEDQDKPFHPKVDLEVV